MIIAIHDKISRQHEEQKALQSQQQQQQQQALRSVRTQLDGKSDLRSNPLKNFDNNSHTDTQSNERLGYNKSLIYVDGAEYSFEEVRAARYVT